MIIIVTGTPGTGKTTLSSMLASKLGGRHIDVSRLIEEEGLWVSVDEERSNALVADIDAVKRRIRAENSRVLIIDSHFGEEFASGIRDEEAVVLILRLDPFILAERLRRRGWPKRKIRENVEAEILGVCTANALSSEARRVCEIDATGLTAERLLDKALRIMRGEEECHIHVDWLKLYGERVLDLLSSLEE